MTANSTVLKKIGGEKMKIVESKIRQGKKIIKIKISRTTLGFLELVHPLGLLSQLPRVIDERWCILFFLSSLPSSPTLHP